MKIYLPFTGEFGGELLKIAPAIHGDPYPKIVCCEVGKECLYPSASKIHTIDCVQESFKATVGSRNDEEIYENIKKLFGPNYRYVEPLPITTCPKMFTPKSSYSFESKYDVVIFPRCKTYHPEFNWDGWHDLVHAFYEAGLSVFAAGHRNSTLKLSCQGVYKYISDSSIDLHTTINAINHSKVRIGPLTALHVLSQMCGQPSTVMTTSDGRMLQNVQKKANLSYLDFADHKKVGYNVLKTFKIYDIVEYVKTKIKEADNG